jgi:hypothetical protein
VASGDAKVLADLVRTDRHNHWSMAGAQKLRRHVTCDQGLWPQPRGSGPPYAKPTAGRHARPMGLLLAHPIHRRRETTRSGLEERHTISPPRQLANRWVGSSTDAWRLRRPTAKRQPGQREWTPPLDVLRPWGCLASAPGPTLTPPEGEARQPEHEEDDGDDPQEVSGETDAREDQGQQ